MDAVIIDRGRGPEIQGTRITVYEIFYQLQAGNDAREIARFLHLTEEQVDAAVKYIQAHQAEVQAVHQQIEDRNARGNPPEVEAKLHKSAGKLQEAMRRIGACSNQESIRAGDPSRQ